MKRISLFAITFLITLCINAQSTFKFDKGSEVSGCANVLLQKNSPDLEYELRIDLQPGNLVEKKELDINKYPKFIAVYLNQYSKGNDNIVPPCNDVIGIELINRIDTYKAVTGTLIINKTLSNHKISVTIKNVVLENDFGKQIKLPLEIFKNVSVGGLGG